MLVFNVFHASILCILYGNFMYFMQVFNAGILCEYSMQVFYMRILCDYFM